MHARLTEPARDDLHQIYAYLVPRSPQGLQRMLAAVFTTIRQLESFPLLGRLGEVDGTREITVPGTDYRLVYRLNEPYYVDIVRVLHGKLKYPLDGN